MQHMQGMHEDFYLPARIAALQRMHMQYPTWQCEESSAQAPTKRLAAVYRATRGMEMPSTP